MIKFVSILSAVVAAVLADRLENTYLPPSSARTAGGSSFLAPPHHPTGSAFRSPSSAATSYAAPASGPVPSGLYNAPSVRTSYSAHSGGAPIGILRLDNDNGGDGNYRFAYETENHISHQESGELKNSGTDHEAESVHGSYSFTAPDGVTYTVNYVADENGFRATGDHLPTPPPVPEAIQRSLEITAAAGSGYSTGTGAGYAGSVSRPEATQRSGGYRY